MNKNHSGSNIGDVKKGKGSETLRFETGYFMRKSRDKNNEKEKPY